MVGGSFITYRDIWHNDVSNSERTIKYARAPTRDKFCTAQRDHLLEKANSKRRSHTRMKDRELFPLYRHFVHWMPSNLAIQMS
jgi:hypothetical protein